MASDVHLDEAEQQHQEDQLELIIENAAQLLAANYPTLEELQALSGDEVDVWIKKAKESYLNADLAKDDPTGVQPTIIENQIANPAVDPTVRDAAEEIVRERLP